MNLKADERFGVRARADGPRVGAHSLPPEAGFVPRLVRSGSGMRRGRKNSGKPIKKSSIRGMNQSTHSTATVRMIRFGLPMAAVALLIGCGYRFTGAPTDNSYPPELKTIVLESAVNNTIVTGIETELTNELRQEFALGSGLTPVRSGGDAILKTVISSYVDTPSTYKADG